MKQLFTPEACRFYLSGNPWIRLLLSFGSGIALALFISPQSGFFYKEMYGLLAFLLLAYLLALYRKNGLGLKKWVPGTIGLLFLFCTGFQLTRGSISLHSPQHFSKRSWRILYIQVNSVPECRGKNIRFEAKVLQGIRHAEGKPDRVSGSLGPPATERPAAKRQDGVILPPGRTPPPSRATPQGWKPPQDRTTAPSRATPQPRAALPLTRVKGRLLVYLRPGKRSIPEYGDHLLIAPDYREVPPPRNPAEFDYRGYLSGKDIHHQAFLSARQWHFTGQHSGNPLVRQAARLQKRCVGAFKKVFKDKGDATLLSAFVLGHRSGMDRATEAAFADTGTIHILSVSGLHVAILYWLVCFILKPLSRLPAGKLLQLLLATCAITAYAFITGLSPPVCRASWMLILYAVASFLAKQHKAGNVLALTAFLLLAGNPLVLTDVGFQLSFLAAAGLAGFCPPLLRLYSPSSRAIKKRAIKAFAHDGHQPGSKLHACKRTAHQLAQLLLKYLWSMAAVSLAAQLATFPLTVFYFHRFPVYFLPANLLLIPLTTLILYGGVLLLLVSGTGTFALSLAGLLSSLIDLMKSLMHFFSELPGAVVKGLWISAFECLGLYLLVVWITFFLLSRKAAWLTASLGALALLVLFSTLENFRQSRQRRLICFHTKRTTVIGFLAGKTAVLLEEKRLDRQTFEYSVQPFLDRSGIKRICRRPLREDFSNRFMAKKGYWMQFAGLRLLLLDRHFRYPRNRGRVLRCDLLLVAENTYLQMEKIRQVFKVETLVNSAESSNALEKFLENYCRDHAMRFYSLKRSGAFLLNLSITGRY